MQRVCSLHSGLHWLFLHYHTNIKLWSTILSTEGFCTPTHYKEEGSSIFLCNVVEVVRYSVLVGAVPIPHWNFSGYSDGDDSSSVSSGKRVFVGCTGLSTQAWRIQEMKCPFLHEIKEAPEQRLGPWTLRWKVWCSTSNSSSRWSGLLVYSLWQVKKKNKKK